MKLSLFESRSSRSGTSYVEDYRGINAAGFYGLQQEATDIAKTAQADPAAFRDDLVRGGVPADAATAYTHDLMQRHFDMPGVLLVQPE